MSVTWRLKPENLREFTPVINLALSHNFGGFTDIIENLSPEWLLVASK